MEAYEGLIPENLAKALEFRYLDILRTRAKHDVANAESYNRQERQNQLREIEEDLQNLQYQPVQSQNP